MSRYGSPLITKNSSTQPFYLARSALLLAVVAATAQAQPGAIEEIVVSADFRQSNLNDIPASVSVLDQELIQRRNALHIEELLSNAPNVNLAAGASRARYVQIRGIGERGQFTEPLNASVGILIDGVDFSGIGGAAMLYDLEQVEVLLGPQGTRYGSNALAGLINLQSRAASRQLSYGLQLQGENYAGRGVAGYVSGPLGDNLQYRLSAQGLESDGFGNNLFLGRPTNTRNEQTLRAKLHWDIQDDIQLDLSTAWIDIDNGYDAFALDNGRDTLADEPGRDTQDAQLTSLKLTIDSFAAFRLEALFGYADSDSEYSFDEDWLYRGFHADEYSSTDNFFRRHRNRSAEVRLISTDAGALFAGRTHWITGLYTLRQDQDLKRLYTWLPAPFSSAFDIDRDAWYLEANTALNSNWSLDTGIRAEHFSSRYHDSEGLAFTPDDTLAGGKLALNYHTAAGNLLYLSASRGYKTGGFNTDGTLDADLREFGAELLWNYEFGFKGSLLDDRLQVQAALFTMEREDIQISSSTVRMRDNGSSEFIDFIGTAAGGRNSGLELNARLRASGTVTLYGNLGLLDTEYESFVNAIGENLDGREQAHAPGHQYTLGASWQLHPAWLLDINVQGRDAFYFSDSHSARSQRYTLLNASLGWQHNNWRATLWGRNLSDRDYAVRGYFFGNDPRDGYLEHTYTQLGEPLRFGLTLNLDY